MYITLHGTSFRAILVLYILPSNVKIGLVFRPMKHRGILHKSSLFIYLRTYFAFDPKRITVNGKRCHLGLNLGSMHPFLRNTQLDVLILWLNGKKSVHI